MNAKPHPKVRAKSPSSNGMLPNLPRAMDIWHDPGPTALSEVGSRVFSVSYTSVSTALEPRLFLPVDDCRTCCMRHASDPELHLWHNLPVLRSSPDQRPCKCTPQYSQMSLSVKTSVVSHVPQGSWYAWDGSLASPPAASVRLKRRGRSRAQLVANVRAQSTKSHAALCRHAERWGGLPVPQRHRCVRHRQLANRALRHCMSAGYLLGGRTVLHIYVEALEHSTGNKGPEGRGPSGGW